MSSQNPEIFGQPVVGNLVRVRLGEISDIYVIKAVIDNKIYIAPSNQPEETSLLIKDSLGQWRVDGANQNYQIEFIPPQPTLETVVPSAVPMTGPVVPVAEPVVGPVVPVIGSFEPEEQIRLAIPVEMKHLLTQIQYDRLVDNLRNDKSLIERLIPGTYYFRLNTKTVGVTLTLYDRKTKDHLKKAVVKPTPDGWTIPNVVSGRTLDELINKIEFMNTAVDISPLDRPLAIPLDINGADQAASAGSLAALQQFALRGIFPNNSTILRMVDNGYFDIIELLDEYNIIQSRNLGQSMGEEAARKGNLDSLKWLRARGFPLTSSAANKAAANGQIAMLDWLESIGILPDQKVANEVAIFVANETQAIRVLDWLFQRGIAPKKIDKEPLYTVTVTGRLEILKWLYAHGISPTQYIADLAAENGRLNILIWLDSIGISATYNGAIKAKKNGHTEVVTWLSQHGVGGEYI